MLRLPPVPGRVRSGVLPVLGRVLSGVLPVLGRVRDGVVTLELDSLCDDVDRDRTDVLRLGAERVIEPECLILPRLAPPRDLPTANTRVLPIIITRDATMKRRLPCVIVRFVLFIIHLHSRSGQKFHFIRPGGRLKLKNNQ